MDTRPVVQFFAPPREHFFRPLVHDNRELCAVVLRHLHERVHGANADYAEALTREVVLEVILRTLTDPALRPLAFDEGRAVPAEEERSYAGELLRKLKEHGWLDDYRDPIDLRPTLKLSRAGKAFSETFANLDDSRAKTRQRNMRSARKALAAFLATRDPDELLDAHEFASRVVQDLQDDIEYFRNLIQSLTREALEQKVAWGEFNEFIEKRFAREYAVRLVADSAERHRGQIVETLDAVRALADDLRIQTDANLLQLAPWLEREVQDRSPTLWLADRIESMVEAACGLKLPMLRSEMNNYVRRFTSLLRQALSLDYGAESALGRTMAWLKDRPASAHDLLLDALAERLATSEVRLPGGVLRWTVRDREAAQAEQAPLVVDDKSRLNAALRRAEAEAFAFSDQDVLRGLLPYLANGPVTLAALPVATAADAVRVLHAVGAARSTEGRRLMRARKTADQMHNAFFRADNYELEADAQASQPPPSH
ncbi:Wadjet anti-phage system protein JetA family protein [Variovorax sp. J31P179]|uniref:Wadjet anti-phage system protein JetA family protein n=1 Tax=Variovorax sp. J31P179 TaxID=3053508 RepID=UPI002578BAD4|nr:Wadjet anti-phage system protein JetA family protein [Variovorax sp. J31P179]